MGLDKCITNATDKEPVDVGDAASTPRLGRFPGRGPGNPFQYPCLENPTDRGLVGYSPLGKTNSWTHTHTHTMIYIHH